MDYLFEYISSHIEQAEYILFGLILLSGLNVPISIDILLLLSGAITSVFLEGAFLKVYFLVYTASLIAGWEAYWIGRIVGPKICTYPFFRHILSQERLKKLEGLYQKNGFLTFMIGRFIPGGVRNALFMSSGLLKMPFQKFVVCDFFSCFLPTLTLFYIGFIFGENYQEILQYFQHYQKSMIAIAILFVALLLFSTVLKRPRTGLDNV